ncbi:MAG TPA: response regulator [Candidatus Bathyarchaeota archaeon]|nr:response regulator [Candidatus Bathyarchaeota archaeon]
MNTAEKVDILDLLIDVLMEHERRLNDISERIEALLNSLAETIEPQEMEETPEPEAPIPREIKILIVDDDEFLVDTFQLLLEDSGFEVDTALTGSQALVMASRRSYDLAILDYKLPDMTGVQLSNELKKRTRDINTILLTGQVEAYGDGLLDGVSDGVLLKPVSPEELIKITEKLGKG